MNKTEAQEYLRLVKGNLALSGIYLTKQEEELILQNATGEMSDEEFRQKVLELVYEEDK